MYMDNFKCIRKDLKNDLLFFGEGREGGEGRGRVTKTMLATSHSQNIWIFAKAKSNNTSMQVEQSLFIKRDLLLFFLLYPVCLIFTRFFFEEWNWQFCLGRQTSGSATAAATFLSTVRILNLFEAK